MEYITELSSYDSDRQCAVTLGKFDGLHLGHQKLIDKITEYADKNKELSSVVFAMDMSGFLLNKGITRKLLMTNQERVAHLETKVDYLFECPFTDEFARMEPEVFIRDILVGKLHALHIVVGADYHFGHQKRGDVHMLARYAKQYGYHLDIIAKERYEGRIISSTYIREALLDGNTELANQLLGYSYTVQGKVEHGRKLGRTLGFPTMNVTPEPEKLLPKNGVHFCRILIDGGWYNGIGNVGMKPTVTNERKVLVEVFVLDYEADAYGKTIDILFLTFERGEKKFSTIEELKKQVDRDIISGKEYFYEG